MTRILSYNILVGATRRVDPLTSMIKAANPDVVGLVEATNPRVVEELARRLDMQHVMSAYPRHWQDWQIALLSRLPIIYTKTHLLPAMRKYLPQRGYGSVLLTTRASAVGSLATSLEVETMGFVEGTQLLLRRAHRVANAFD